ncbi:MAG: tyrosine-type recombinase/integrase [Halobacteriaceae archaeon]
MADVNDPSNLGGKLQRRWEQLKEADIDDRDRDAISAFVNHRREMEEVARSTRTNDLSTLRCASERADAPLVDIDIRDVRELLRILATPRDEGGYGLDPDGTGMFGYKRALKLFFEFLDAEPGYGDYPFYDRIKMPDLDFQGAADEDEMLSQHEVEDLKDAANHQRDRALVAVLADTGMRATMLLSLRVRDVTIGDDTVTYRPNTDVVDGLKNVAAKERPLLHSQAELRAWLTTRHPDRGTPNAPLWPVVRGYDPDNPTTCALSDDRLRDMLAECADRAGIDKPVEPHNFRRVALTRMSNSDRFTPQEIVHLTGWADTRMLDVYDYTSDEERNATILDAAGFDAPDEDEKPAEPRPCENCRTMLGPAQRYCPQCGEPATPAAKAAEETVIDDGLEDMADDDLTAREKRVVAETLRRLRTDPDKTVAVDPHDDPSED